VNVELEPERKSAMLKEGDYVRLAVSSHQFGTVHQGTQHNGEPGILFRLDARLAEKLPDFFLLAEGDVEVCGRPSDREIEAINAILRDNPPQPAK
jgi:predicted N-formylglutamate amidohydrolase